MTWFHAALGAAILFGVAGQLLLKQGAGTDDFVSQLFRPATIAGLALYALAALFYIVALRKIPVSIAFPSVSLSYVVVALAGNLLWNEPLGAAQIGGLALICAGVLVLSQA